MAKIETTFIRPKELYTPETGETKVVYDGYQNNPHELITEDGFAGALDTAMPTALAKAQVIETTWQELKDKRDNGQLIAGSLYRITDYQCTTTQENTQSAGHQFDIVLLALSANKLAEEGWAMMNESNIYDVTFSDGVTKKCWIYEDKSSELVYITDISTMLCINDAVTSNVEIDDENKTAICSDYDSTELTSENPAYNYFQNSNLSAWKVWYSLDNDTARFAWADDSVDEDSLAFITITGGKGETFYRDSADDLNNLFAWKKDRSPSPSYTASQTPSVGDTIYYDDGTDTGDTVISFTPAHEGTGLPNGRGVIYRLIDEWNNDVGYDFKNIQFARKLTDGAYDADNGVDTWVYTISGNYNATIVDATIPDGDGNTFASHSIINLSFELLYNVFLGGASNCYVDCNSGNNTIINGSSIILLSCNELVCGEDGESAVYINNKKVLTEE